MSAVKPPILENATNLQSVLTPPGWGFVGQNWTGKVGGTYGVVRTLVAGAWEYQPYNQSPWKVNPRDTTQLLAPLQSELSIENGYETLYSLCTRLHKRKRVGEAFTRDDKDLRLLESVASALLQLLYQLKQQNIPLRILDPTVIVFYASSNAGLASDQLPAVRVYAPDVGFDYQGLDQNCVALAAEKRTTPETTRQRNASAVPFSNLWGGKTLHEVNAGLPEEEELVGVARLFAWVMEGEIPQSLPSRASASQEALSFWSTHTCDAWRVLVRVLGRPATESPQAGPIYQDLAKYSVIHHFLSSGPNKTTGATGVLPGVSRPWFAYASLVGLIGLALLAVIFREPIRKFFTPEPPPPVFAVCPDCGPGVSSVYEQLGSIQQDIDRLHNFEATYVAKKNRFPQTSPLTRPPIAEEVQEMTVADLETYVQALGSGANRLTEMAKLADKSTQTSDADQQCLNRIAIELEVHLYQSCDAIGRFGSRDLGIQLRTRLKQEITSIADRIDNHLTLSERTIRRLNNTFDETIYPVSQP